MQLVILHHHLNPGGVTRVIENQLWALANAAATFKPERVLIIHGGRNENWPQEALAAGTPFELSTAVVPGLDYEPLRPATGAPLPAELASLLESKRFAPDRSILHWHNHSLGKNSDVPRAAATLAQQGYRTLLQIHDFAEDFRPDNYRLVRDSLDRDGAERIPAVLYPQSSGIHYATLNARDHAILTSAGVAADRLHLLPNPVAAPPPCEATLGARRQLCDRLELAGSGPIILYPVRGIRRKNLGELLLWSALHPQACFLLTLAPKNPSEQPSFQRWRQLAQRLGLQCRLGIAATAGLSFAELLAASDALITTSVAEGFGMTFLECWLVGRRLLGRDLPEITTEFVDAGIDLRELTRRTTVPNDWIDLDAAASELTGLCRRTYESMSLSPPSQQELCEQFAASMRAGIDFAQLPVDLQCGIIERVARSASDRRQLLQVNPELAIPDAPADDLICRNAAVVEREYSIEAISERLGKVYAAVARSTPSAKLEPPAHGAEVLRSFLDPDRLQPLRIEP